MSTVGTVFKTCKACSSALPLDAFAKSTRNLGGHTPRCRKCLAIATRLRKDKDPERARSASRAAVSRFRKTEKGKAYARAYRKTSRHKATRSKRRKAVYLKSRGGVLLGHVRKPIPETKVCRACRIEKPVADFSFNIKKRPASECKRCAVVRSARYAVANRTQNIARSKAWYESNKGTENFKAKIQSARTARISNHGPFPSTKVCGGCKEDKKAEEFGINDGCLRSACKLCERARVKAYTAQSPHRAHRGRLRCLAWYAIKKDDPTFRAKESARSVFKSHRRRAHKLAAPGRGVTKNDWARILDVFGHRCAYCPASDVKLTMDHVEPLAKKGAHDPENIVPACAPCNASKNDRFLLEWAFADFGTRPIG